MTDTMATKNTGTAADLRAKQKVEILTNLTQKEIEDKLIKARIGDANSCTIFW